MEHKEIKVTRTVEGFTLVFKWWGGEYIDICWPSGDAFDVIHVDYENVDFNRATLKEEVADWINNPETDHAHDLREYAYGR